jgi:hypothetical protein
VFSEVNKARIERGEQPYLRMADVPANEAASAIRGKTDKQWGEAIANLQPPTKKEVEKIVEEITGTVGEKLKNTAVVDQDGVPLLLYHGTPVGWEGEYKISDHNLSDTGFYGQGIYFTPHADTAENYALKESANMTAEELANYSPNIKRAYTNIENPFKTWDIHSVETRFGDPHDAVSEAAAKMTERMKAAGYNGVVVYGPDNAIREVVAFDPGQAINAVNPSLDAKYTAHSQAVTYLATNPVPYTSGGTPGTAQSLYNNKEGFTEALNKTFDDIKARWGETRPLQSRLNPEQTTAAESWITEMGDRAAVVRTKTEVYANKLRDFVLHDYLKTYGDVAAGFIMPYQYWYTQTYKKFIERIVSDPKVMTLYSKYKTFMTNEHAGLPDWWKYNIPITFLPGTSADNPLYFNLEATVNPLNSLFGVDFNDPYKRVDWLSSSLDDLSKFGPTPFVPMTWLVAANLYKKGEADAASRWLGRLIPQTSALEAAMNIEVGGQSLSKIIGLQKFPTGTPISGIRYGDFDPFVNLFEGGLDPYAQRRVRRALAWEVQKGTISPEQAIDTAYNQTGPMWDDAVRQAIQQTAPGVLVSAFGGVGLKPRTKEDMAIDQFYSDYGQLISLRNTMSATEYQKAWDQMRISYPFMDVVLIGGKAQPDRDSAFSYNVLSRIPPGQMSQFLEIAGINSDMIDQFYTGKGTFKDWTQQDKDRFMAGMVDIGSLLKMPTGATRTEWTDAKIAYDQMTQLTTQQFGATIQDTIDAYYSQDPGIKRRTFLDQHPEVSQAMTFQTDYITKNALLSKYYGGLDTLERYWRNEMYADLNKKFPKIQAVRDQYNALKIQDEAATAAYLQKHPELVQYAAAKDKLDQQLSETFPDIDPIQSEYDRIKAEEPTKAKAYYAQHPELKAYIKAQTAISALLKKQFPTYTALSYGLAAVKQAQKFYDSHPELSAYGDAKTVWENKLNRSLVKQSLSLPNLPPYQTRPDFVPQGQTQTALQAQTQPQPQPTWADFQSMFSESRATYLEPLILAGTPLSYAASQELDYVASRNGFYDSNEMLRAIGMALQNK